jgi:signal transduction histidine kinase
VGIVLALAVAGLFEVLSLPGGVRSVRRLRARVSEEAEQRIEGARRDLAGALAPGGAPSWDAAAALALGRGLASEVEVIAPGNRVLFSRPTVAPVTHTLGPQDARRLEREGRLTVVVQDGPAVRTLTYLPLPRDGQGIVLRLAALAPDLEDELRERRLVFFGHLASLGALALAAVLVLLPGRRAAPPSPEGALHAYEQAMERLRDRGEEMSARHEAERHRMEEAIREKEALARAGELTAGIAHEVRNGLGTIGGYARMLERAGLAADPAAAVRAILEECETLETVVRRFTDFVKLEKLQREETDLARLLERVVAREQRGREGVATRLRGLDAPLVVRADEELLERAFENVVRNAVEASARGGGHVDVTVLAAGGLVDIFVEDDGPGLAPDHPGEIRPFYTTRPGGLGLGLPLARKIVLLHGGTLQLEGREAGGVRVTLSLPAGDPPPPPGPVAG